MAKMRIISTFAVSGLQSMKEAIDGLVVSMDKEENDAVNLSFMVNLDDWARFVMLSSRGLVGSSSVCTLKYPRE